MAGSVSGLFNPNPVLDPGFLNFTALKFNFLKSSCLRQFFCFRDNIILCNNVDPDSAPVVLLLDQKNERSDALVKQNIVDLYENSQMPVDISPSGKHTLHFYALAGVVEGLCISTV